MERNKTKEEIKRLTIKELFKLGKPLRFTRGVWKDGQKLEKLLTDICKVVNVLVTCSQKQTRLTATELVARPTYVEEFMNIRDNVSKAIMPRDDEAQVQIDDDWDNISHLSKMSISRSRTLKPSFSASP